MFADGPIRLILLWEQQSPIRGCPGRASVALASTRRRHKRWQVGQDLLLHRAARRSRIALFLHRAGSVGALRARVLARRHVALSGWPRVGAVLHCSATLGLSGAAVHGLAGGGLAAGGATCLRTAASSIASLCDCEAAGQYESRSQSDRADFH